MADAARIPPLQGCLCCHQEDGMTLSESRKLLGLGSEYPTLKCSFCGSVALLDIGSGAPDDWRIRYRRINPAPEFYYVALHFGAAGWLSAEDALAISTNGYVQRQRMQQVARGDLRWLKPAPLNPPPPLMDPAETVYLTLKGVTFQEAPPPGLFARRDGGAVLDSGKFYVTGQKLHLLGQRRDWTHALGTILHVDYDDRAWVVDVQNGEEPQQYRGLNSSEQYDAQLVAAILEALRQRV